MKKILITAGATWVKVDAVRILTNRFTGRSGLYLARALKKKGHQITLIANSHCLGKTIGITLLDYRYFKEFKGQVTKALSKKKYDAIIHMAAVSDYRLTAPAKGKIVSGKRSLTLELVPAEKIIKTIRLLAKESLLIQFKLEAKRRAIIQKAYQSLKKNKSDFVVANALEDLDNYRAWLIDRRKKVTELESKKALADTLNNIIIKGL